MLKTLISAFLEALLLYKVVTKNICPFVSENITMDYFFIFWLMRDQVKPTLGAQRLGIVPAPKVGENSPPLGKRSIPNLCIPKISSTGSLISQKMEKIDDDVF